MKHDVMIDAISAILGASGGVARLNSISQAPLREPL